MERNRDEGWRERDRNESRDWSARREEHGELGEGRTGPQDRYPERNDEGRWPRDLRGNYGAERPDDWSRRGQEYRGSSEPYRSYDDRRRDEERRSTWERNQDPWEHTAPQWGGRGTWRDEERRYQSQPTYRYQDEPRWRPQPQEFRGEQFGYRVGQERPASREGEREYGGTWGSSALRRGRAPRDYRRPDDRIRDEICETIVRHSDVDATEVEVQVAAGEVTMNGVVDDRHCKRELEDIAERVFGVQDVHNNLRVRKSAWRELGDRIFGNDEKRDEGTPTKQRPKA
jgi:hypothetical protein